MFNLPDELQQIIWELCIDKRHNWDKVNAQFLKGGFSRTNLNVSNYLKHETDTVQTFWKWLRNRGKMVSRWILNVNKFEEMHPDRAMYLSEKKREKKLVKALKNRELSAQKKQARRDDTLRAKVFMLTRIKFLRSQELKKYDISRSIYLKIDPNIKRQDPTQNENDLESKFCKGRIVGIYCTPLVVLHGKDRYDKSKVDKAIKVRIRVCFEGGQYRYYSPESLVERIIVSVEDQCTEINDLGSCVINNLEYYKYDTNGCNFVETQRYHKM